MRSAPLIWALAVVLAGLLAAALPPPPLAPKVVVFEARTAGAAGGRLSRSP